MHKALITIGITCFNARETVLRSIKSAQNQTWTNLEILIVDDGSNDDSTDIISEIAKHDNRIKIIFHAENLGTAEARTTLVDHASGEYLAFLDDDDEAMPDRIVTQYRRIKKYEEEFNTNLIACYTSRNTIQVSGTEKYVTAMGVTDPCPHGDIVINYLLCNIEEEGFSFGEIGSGTLMARMSVFRKIGNFDKQFNRFEEWDWAIRLGYMDGHFIGTKAALIDQYKTDTVDKSSYKPLHYALLLRRKHKEYLLKNGNYLFSILSAYAKFYYAKKRRFRFKAVMILSFILKPKIILGTWLASRNISFW